MEVVILFDNVTLLGPHLEQTEIRVRTRREQTTQEDVVERERESMGESISPRFLYHP